MKRIPEIDLTKTFCILVSMIGIHTMYDLAELPPSVPANVLNILATAWGAPVFMFCMGVTLGFSRHQDVNNLFHRGIHLITVGMALNVLRYGPMAFTSYVTHDPGMMKGLAQIFSVDILQFAGLAFMLLALCRRLRMGGGTILILSLLMSGAGTLLIGCSTGVYVVDQVLGYFCHTPTCSCFPLLNWFVFVAVGNRMGKMYRECDDMGRVFRFLIPLCGIIAIVHQYLSITGQSPMFKTLQNDWEYYSMPILDALCIAFGVAPFMIGIFRLLARIMPEKWMVVLAYPSKHINQFYCISWVWIMWIAYFLYFIEPATTFAAFVPRWIGIILLTTLTVVVYNRHLRERIVPCFSHYEKVWAIAVWGGIIAFGAWYFTYIPGPYMMLY